MRYFREALAGRGKVLVADMSYEAPAMHEGDGAYIVPAVSDNGYVEHVLDLCVREGVGLLVSLNDLELPLLGEARKRFVEAGVGIAVSEMSVIDLCFDKWKTYCFLKELGLRAPKTYLSLNDAKAALKTGDIEFPVIVKPRWGTASIGLDFPEDEGDLDIGFALAQRRVMRSFLAGASGADPDSCVMIQEKLPGREYGVDLINDLDGRYQATFVKRKLGMRAGETDRAITEEVPEIEAVGARLAKALGHVGIVDCDMFWDGNEVGVLEMNPRFGGGYPFSHLAGANVPAALLAWASGEGGDPDWLRVRYGVGGAKCDRLVLFSDEEALTGQSKADASSPA